MSIFDRAPMADAGIWKRESEVTGEAELTGRYLISFKRSEEAVAQGVSALENSAGVSHAEHGGRDPAAAVIALQTGELGTVVLDRLGIAIVAAHPDQESAVLTVSEQNPAIRHVEPERMFYACDTTPYLEGYRDGVTDYAHRLHQREEADADQGPMGQQIWDESVSTWGVQATGAHTTPFNGEGLSIAILDTGIMQDHPAFSGRDIAAESFVPGQSVEDGNGHGTHCAGIACAGLSEVPRYGVATGSRICVGKVLGNDGRGTNTQILAGIDWAMGQGCQVVSMSLGAPARTGESYSEQFEEAAQAAAEAGTLLLAATGNGSKRPSQIKPVGHPANCPSVVAVAAIGSDLDVAPFSCGHDSGIGKVDLAAPGVDVFSSWPQPPGFRRLSGTSMATPHVAGIALLTTQAAGLDQADAVRVALVRRAQRLPQCSSADVGAGLVQAPR